MVKEGERVQYQEFIDRVRRRAELASFAEAEAVTQATLTTLGEYLTGGEGHDLVSQLPQGLAEHLRRQPPERSEFFSLNDFLQRVGEEEGVGIEAAEAHACAVMNVLQEAVSKGEMEDVRRQFPSEFDTLFGWLRRVRTLHRKSPNGYFWFKWGPAPALGFAPKPGLCRQILWF